MNKYIANTMPILSQIDVDIFLGKVLYEFLGLEKQHYAKAISDAKEFCGRHDQQFHLEDHDEDCAHLARVLFLKKQYDIVALCETQKFLLQLRNERTHAHMLHV